MEDQNWIRKRQRPLLTLVDPSVIVINHLWGILSQRSLHITKTMLSLYWPKWSTFLHTNGHSLSPSDHQIPTFCMDPWLMESHQFESTLSKFVIAKITWIMRLQPGIAVTVYTKITEFSLYPVSSTFIYSTSSMQIHFLQVKYGSIPWNIPIPHEFNQFWLRTYYMPNTVYNSKDTMTSKSQCLPPRSLHSNGEVRQSNSVVSARAEFSRLWSLTIQGAPSCPGLLTDDLLICQSNPQDSSQQAAGDRGTPASGDPMDSGY